MTIGSVNLLSNSSPGSWVIYRNYRDAMFGIVFGSEARQLAVVSETDFHVNGIGSSEVYIIDNCFIVPEIHSLIVGSLDHRTNSLHFCQEDSFFRVLTSANTVVEVSATSGHVIKPSQIDYSFLEWSLRRKIGETSREVFRVKKGELVFEPFVPNP